MGTKVSTTGSELFKLFIRGKKENHCWQELQITKTKQKSVLISSQI